jgi:hypothetical protein
METYTALRAINPVGEGTTADCATFPRMIRKPAVPRVRRRLSPP